MLQPSFSWRAPCSPLSHALVFCRCEEDTEKPKPRQCTEIQTCSGGRPVCAKLQFSAFFHGVQGTKTLKFCYDLVCLLLWRGRAFCCSYSPPSSQFFLFVFFLFVFFFFVFFFFFFFFFFLVFFSSSNKYFTSFFSLLHFVSFLLLYPFLIYFLFPVFLPFSSFFPLFRCAVASL